MVSQAVLQLVSQNGSFYFDASHILRASQAINICIATIGTQTRSPMHMGSHASRAARSFLSTELMHRVGPPPHVTSLRKLLSSTTMLIVLGIKPRRAQVCTDIPRQRPGGSQYAVLSFAKLLLLQNPLHDMPSMKATPRTGGRLAGRLLRIGLRLVLWFRWPRWQGMKTYLVGLPRSNAFLMEFQDPAPLEL